MSTNKRLKEEWNLSKSSVAPLLFVYQTYKILQAKIQHLDLQGCQFCIILVMVNSESDVRAALDDVRFLLSLPMGCTILPKHLRS